MSRPRPATLSLYALATSAIAPAAPAILRRRAGRGREDPERLGERLGRAGADRPAGLLIWLHGASVGEGLSLLPLAERLRHLRSEATILVTTGTRSSAQVLSQRLPGGAIHQFAPVDTPAATARFIAHWRPNLGVFVESELWPNLICAAQSAGVPLALVSARMSAASARGWRMVPGAARAVLGAFGLVMARDRDAAQRFEALGAQVDDCWDAKLGAPPLPIDDRAMEALRGMIGARPVLLAASTHPGEEAVVLSAFADVARDFPDALLIIAPRHADRGQAVEAIVRGAGFTVARRSVGAGCAGVQVWIADTLGELGAWYRLARLAVVGGSLVPGVGGHNPLEPARLGCPFVAGAHVEAWPIYADLIAAGATSLVEGANDLRGWMPRALHADPVIEAMAVSANEEVARRDQVVDAVAVRLAAMVSS